MDASGLKAGAAPQAQEEAAAGFASLCTENEEKGVVSITEDGSMDRKGNPAIKGKSGGWSSAVLLLVNQGLATLAFFGVGVNLVLFLSRVMQQDTADAANNVSKWTGTVYIFSLIGAFMSDSYWGRYLTCAVFQIIFVLGLVMLSLSSWLLLVKPAGCGDGKVECRRPSEMGASVFHVSIYLVAFGNGGYQPSIATFGSDQFDENDAGESRSKVTFFSYFYFALNAGSLFSNTILVYFEDSGNWAAGFWASAASAAAALLLFYAGTPRYRHFRPCGNPLTRVAQVFVASARKWKVEGEELYEVEGKESAIAGSRKIMHTDEFRFLDRAATLTAAEYCDVDAGRTDPWRLCTVTQVEEVKRVLKLLPIWLCTIMYSVAFTQMASLFVEQGDGMDTAVGSGGATFRIPAASMSAFDILSVLAFIVLYRRAMAPAARRLTGDPRGLSELQRMGAGLAVAVLAMVAAGAVEVARLRRVVDAPPPRAPSSLSILWQIPQYALVGVSEALMYVGQLEFFASQAPDGLKSLGSSLCMASISLGNFFSSVLVSAVVKLTPGEGNPGWIAGNLNRGHLDRFYFLVAALVAVDFFAYLLCARRYKLAGAQQAKVIGTEEEEQGMAGGV